MEQAYQIIVWILLAVSLIAVFALVMLFTRIGIARLCRRKMLVHRMGADHKGHPKLCSYSANFIYIEGEKTRSDKRGLIGRKAIRYNKDNVYPEPFPYGLPGWVQAEVSAVVIDDYQMTPIVTSDPEGNVFTQQMMKDMEDEKVTELTLLYSQDMRDLEAELNKWKKAALNPTWVIVACVAIVVGIGFNIYMGVQYGNAVNAFNADGLQEALDWIQEALQALKGAQGLP